MDWNLVLRLVVAGILGGIVGFERDLRAKEAGLRTHFIVALGSALFMIISQFAFEGRQHDASRVAAQVVSGIGFIGAGVIIFQKNVVRGVTTAAGLWVVAAIGMACGAGMWGIAISATLLTILCLEAVHFLHLNYGEKLVEVSADCPSVTFLEPFLALLKEKRIAVESYHIKDGRAFFRLRLRNRDYVEKLPALISSLENVSVEMIS